MKINADGGLLGDWIAGLLRLFRKILIDTLILVLFIQIKKKINEKKEGHEKGVSVELLLIT